MGHNWKMKSLASSMGGSLVCLTTAAEGHKLASVHGMGQQLLYPVVI
jgi:predicted alpha/beta hydrolase